MNKTFDQAKSIFLSAAEIASPQERRLFVESECRENESLRREVDELLQHQLALGDFLELPAPQLGSLTFHSAVEAAGTVIGPYKLLEQIGEGGFGVVYMAEQTRPVRRKVALKIIKPGMDTKEVIARFEAERQVLAMMDHPNIARIFDGGTTGAESREQEAGSTDEVSLLAPSSPLEAASIGRPYFVMELVRGVPITTFCDSQRLAQADRLKLFVDVCRAVQHAHQKGIIHRDLKPSNVMVTMQDDKAVPKVIDFGVSKAISQQLTEKTLFTAYGQMVGTPIYMSPEQAQLSCLDVDTRSDVYSLGVLLYELITGSTPFDDATLKRAGFDEMRRIIREDEPLRPSARVSTLKGDLLSTVADQRQIDPRRLGQSLRGEIDWIVMKALEKDRNRRYETAGELAGDVVRYLNDEPVLAVAPSRVYRASKFVRRNKVVVIASAAVFLGLIAGIVGTTVGLVSQSRQRVIAERERTAAQFNVALGLQSQRKYDESADVLRDLLRGIDNSTPEGRQRTAMLRLRLADVVGDRLGEAHSLRLYGEALAAYRAAFPAGDTNIAFAVTRVALVLRVKQQFAEAEPLFRESYEIHRRTKPPNHQVIGESAANLANVLITLGRYTEAEPFAYEAIAEHKLAGTLDGHALAYAKLELGRCLIGLKKFPEAEQALLDAQQLLAKTDRFQIGNLALASLYAIWARAVPGEERDAKAREWIRNLFGTFVPPKTFDEIYIDG